MSRLDIAFDIATLQAGYATGRFTPEAVIEEVYARIEAQADPAAWITLRPIAEARALASRSPRGPLHSVPFAVKDNIDCAGLPTTCACPAFAYRPERSARVVELLEAAGAIVMGKTNLDQFATGLNGTRSPHGTPRNAFDGAYVPGGSSSGSAVTVASGIVSFSLGTDTAGSGRVPAAFNNIVGLKPTRGTISARGMVPACRALDTVSVFALTVADADLVYRCAAQFDAEDGFSRLIAAVPPARAGLRFGVPGGALEFCGDAGAARLYDEAVARVRALGHEVVAFDYAPFAEAARLLYQGPWVAERFAAVGDFASGHGADMDATVRAIVLGARDMTASEAFKGFYRLADLVRLAEAEWQKMDVMILPSAPTIYTVAEMLADPIKLNSNLGTYTNFVNLMDLSALAVPAGFDARGLPFGVTLIGRAFEDGLLAGVGDALHRALPGARLGASRHELVGTPPIAAGRHAAAMIQVAVVGAHLSGEPLNRQLTERGGRLVRSSRSARGYSLYELPGTTPAKPGLVFDGSGQGGIEVEVWELDRAGFGSFVGLVPPPLCIGTIALEDGTAVKGFLCEAHALSGARDITRYGGWRAWRAAEGR